MSDPNRTLAAAPTGTAHAGTAAKRVIKRVVEVSANTASCVGLKPPLDAL